MITGFDHVVILEGDLNEAMRRYEALGFQVERGGVHPARGTENALIPLVNGTYLELQASRDPSRPVRHRLWQRPDGTLRESGEYGGYALTSDDLAGDVDRLKVGGPLFEEPQADSRARQDGQMVKWRSHSQPCQRSRFSFKMRVRGSSALHRPEAGWVPSSTCQRSLSRCTTSPSRSVRMNGCWVSMASTTSSRGQPASGFRPHGA